MQIRTIVAIKDMDFVFKYLQKYDYMYGKQTVFFSGSCSNSTHIHCTMLHKNKVLNYTIPCNMCITSNSNTVLKGDLSY